MGALGAREEALRSVSPEPKEKPVPDSFLEEASHGSCSGANCVLKPRALCPFPQLVATPAGRPLPQPRAALQRASTASVQEATSKTAWSKSHEETH